MTRVISIVVVLMLATSIAHADHIGIYTDTAGQNCVIAPGFNSNVAVIHKFTTGATSLRFKVTFPPQSSFFTFSTNFQTVGTLTNDLAVAYGECMGGYIVVGNVVANWAAGYARVMPADYLQNITYTDCAYGEHPATGGALLVTTSYVYGCFIPVQPSTWGMVKAFYR